MAQVREVVGDLSLQRVHASPTHIESSLETVPASLVSWVSRAVRASALPFALAVEDSLICKLLTCPLNTDVWELRDVTAARADARSLESTSLRVESAWFSATAF